MEPTLPQGGASTPQTQALDSLRAVELGSHPRDEETEQYVAAVIERCTATVTELKGPLPARLLGESDREGRSPVLSRCTRLEVLTCVYAYPPAAWLGLSQLHTLRGVSLNDVSVAAIAAALPRLHTLTLNCHRAPGAPPSVAGFFTDLLPRLRVFCFSGAWPWMQAAPESAGEIAPLPLLEELVWQAEYCSQPEVLREFLGARPRLLHGPYELIAEGLVCQGGSAPGGSTGQFLSRVRELCVTGGPFLPPYLAPMLRAAPRLRVMIDYHSSPSVAPIILLDPAFADLSHPRLQVFASGACPVDAARQRFDECAPARLRRTCFPRLREVKVNGIQYFVTPLGEQK
jgi:hypothetical protein